MQSFEETMTTAVLKRKMCPENIFHVATDFGSSAPKRTKSLTMKLATLGGTQEGYKRETLGDEVKSHSLCILRTIMQHIFALPFIRMDKECDLVKNESKGRRYLDDIAERIERDFYETIEEIMSDVNCVFEEAMKSDGQLTFAGRTLFYKSEDIEFMASQLKIQFENLQGKDCPVAPFQRRENGLSEIICQGENEDLIFEKLKARYENLPECILLAKALDINLSSGIDIGSIEAELLEMELQRATENRPKYRIYKFYPSREHDFDSDKVHHSYIAGYQFHKMITKTTSAPIAMRTILNMSDAIESITYIENDEAMVKYEKQRELFKEQGKVNDQGKVDELLLFHGTAVASLDNILSSNFVLDAAPIQQNSNQETRKKTMMFGKGVYFSEMPSVSLMYGNGLVLCKVMLGSCEVFRPQGISPPDIPDEFDSREIQATDKLGVIHVVKNPIQILPYAVIQLKGQSLTSQFVKPGLGANMGSSKSGTCHVSSIPRVQQNIPNSTVMTPACNIAPSSPTAAPVAQVWTTVPLLRRSNSLSGDKKGVSKTIEAAEIVRDHSEDTEAGSEDTCTVCLESLAGAASRVSLHLCGHKFHTDCLVRLVEHQADPGYVQCPNCQLVHGEKSGNMPGGQMMWTTRPDISLPGYQDCCTIVIKYVFSNGVQEDTHPNPGKPFYAKSFPRHSFLPDNEKGSRVLRMLMTAFQRRLTFTIGRSITRGEEDCVVWNGIHHKTVVNDNGSGHGYPDPGYLDRVIGELEQHGIREDNH